MDTLNTHRCLAGVDEAGLGPILGPLVVAGAALSGPSGRDPWQALQGVVARNRPRQRQIQVADSKKVHQGPHGLARLERTALTWISTWAGRTPRNVRELLLATRTDVDRLVRCPWYEDLGLPLPLANDRADIELTAHLLAEAMRETEIGIAHFSLLCVDVEEFNASIAATDNKGATHLHHYVRVLADILRHAPPGAHVLADRCGCRAHYRHALASAFPEARVAVLGETAEISRYDVVRDDGAIKVTFATGGEERAFPTALASCLAKYLRECVVHVLNDWFAARVPDLRRTAGYWVDGHRFLADVEALIASEGLPRERLVRAR